MNDRWGLHGFACVGGGNLMMGGSPTILSGSGSQFDDGQRSNGFE